MIQSAPVPKSNQLFISGLAVSTTKPAKAAKGNLGQRTAQSTEATSSIDHHRKIQPPIGNDQELREGDEEEEENGDGANGSDHLQLTTKPLNLLSSSLPDNPRKAAIVLAARQKNHRPLPDLMLESRDVLIPRNWNQPEASAVTVETTKAKGPTSCTKRMVVRLLPEGESVIERRPNVMELAIKWDVSSPPSSAGTRKKKALLTATKPVEKTLDWLYDQPPVRQANRPELRRQPTSSTNQAQRAPPPPTDSGNGSARSKDSLTSVRGRQCPMDNGETTAVGRSRAESDPESGYNSPRQCWTGNNHNMRESNNAKLAALADLDEPVKNTFRSAASSASPPKNHFLVSTSAFGSNMNDRNEPVMLPEYPLQRRSPVHQQQATSMKTLAMEPKQVQQPAKFPLNEYPPQQMGSTTSAHYRPTRESHQHHHQCDRDSGIGDVHDRTEEEEEEEEYDDESPSPHSGGQLRRSRSRPCLACHSPPPPAAANKTSGGSRAKSHGKVPYKLAMKAGNPSVKNHSDLEKVIQRRQSYRAPKPAPLSSHARHIRGTLAPPLSAGMGNEPIVDYPDFKRLDSTYRLSYGAHTQTQRRRPKTLTAILNEKSCRQWRS